MAKQKKDRSGKRYVKRDPLDVKLKYEPWRLIGVFAAPLAIVDQLEHDHTIMVENDIPVFRDIDDGKLYETLPALAGFIELFELYEVQYKQQLPLESLRILYKRVADPEAPISIDETRAVRETIEAIRRAMFELTRRQADQLVDDYRLKEALNGNIFD
jgi:hypothetical protein